MPKIMLNGTNYSAPAANTGSGANQGPYPLFKGIFNSGNKSFSLREASGKILEQSVSLECAGYSANVTSRGILIRIKGYYYQSLAFCNEIYLIAPTVQSTNFGSNYVEISCNGYHFNNNFTIYPNDNHYYGKIDGWYLGGDTHGVLFVYLPDTGSITITNIDVL